MNDNTNVKLMGDSEFSSSVGNNTQEQSTAAPTVPGEGNEVEQPVVEQVGTNELNDGTEPSKDNKVADDKKVPEDCRRLISPSP